MNYEEALEYIHSAHRFGKKNGLSNIKYLTRIIGNPQDYLKFVHIAGTNGKGSTATAAACALSSAGYRTGLYISPFVSDFRERIQIDGRPIGMDELVSETLFIKPAVEQTAQAGTPPIEFEIITAIAFHYFYRKHCDIVVLETGIGGRLDSTNIIAPPLVSVITPVSLDHTGMLGSTITAIAGEKCGIIKKGAAAVTSPSQNPDALKVIRGRCKQLGVPLVVPDISKARVLNEGLSGTDVLYKGVRFHIPMCGRHQIGNFLTAYETVSALCNNRFEISGSDITEGFSHASLPGRFEIVSHEPLIVVDGAHNPAAAEVLFYTVKRLLPGRKIVTVMGMLADKEYVPTIIVAAKASTSFIAASPQNPRALDAKRTAEIAYEYCGRVFIGGDMENALFKGMAEACEDGVIIVCGSLYLAGEARRAAKSIFKK